MASRTRERLIDVARQLFVRQGVDNVTMSDIATASDRGRRTIYTYFRTKSDIYQAVVENEASRILHDLEEAINACTLPIERLRTLMEFRFAVPCNELRGYQVWFRSLFARDAKRVSSVRRLVNNRLYRLIDDIVGDGVRRGEFDPGQTARLASTVTLVVRGSDWTQFSELDAEQSERWRRDSIDFILSAIQTRP